MKHNDNISAKPESFSCSPSLTQWHRAQQIFRETVVVLARADHIICVLIWSLCLTLFNRPCWLFSVVSIWVFLHVHVEPETNLCLLTNIQLLIPAWMRLVKSELGFCFFFFSTFKTLIFLKDNHSTHKRQSCDYRGKTGWLSDERRQYQSRPIWGHQHEIWFHKTNAVSFLMCLTFTVNEKVLIARWHFFIIWFQKV